MNPDDEYWLPFHGVFKTLSCLKNRHSRKNYYDNGPEISHIRLYYHV